LKRFTIINSKTEQLIDINECNAGGTNNCHPQAICTNTIGSFTCTCKTGYSGSGVSCTGNVTFFFNLLFFSSLSLKYRYK